MAFANLTLNLTLHPRLYSLTRFKADRTDLSDSGGRFLSIARWDGEATVVSEEAFAPAGGETHDGYRLIAVEGPFALESTGVVAAVVGPLAGAGISLFAFSLWSTDVFLFHSADLDRSLRVLADAGHNICKL